MEEKAGIKALIEKPVNPGTVNWISIRPEKKASVNVVDSVQVTTKDGLVGDHYSGKNGKRQVTLIQEEHLKAVADFLGLEDVDPGLIRRNIVVSGINLLALKERKVQIGEDVIIEVTGPCHPCSRMEENLGEGGYNAMRGHGGITARVVHGGTIKLGDRVVPLEV